MSIAFCTIIRTVVRVESVSQHIFSLAVPLRPEK